MSVRLNFTISAPKAELFYDRFFTLTKKIGETRILFEISKPNLTDFVDVNMEYLDSSETDNPGVYMNAVLFGLGVHVTIYQI